MSCLTIAIPTFQRAKYLDICLASLEKNMPQTIQDDIEVLVIDNNSQDNTAEIIKKHQISMNIRYIRNKENIGPDENFKKCITEATSQYVWIFGDDDVFFPSTLENIIDILKSKETIGLIHLRAKNFYNDAEILDYHIQAFSCIHMASKENFVEKIHTNITFISANIVNKEILLKTMDLKDIPNNNLGQMYWNIICILKSDLNIFVTNEAFGARQFNSGSYNLCEVFGKNFIDMLYLINLKYPISSFIEIYIKRLLMFYLPANIVRIRNGLSKVECKGCFKILYTKYKFRIYFWIFTVPAMILPKKIALLIVKQIEIILKKKNS